MIHPPHSRTSTSRSKTILASAMTEARGVTAALSLHYRIRVVSFDIVASVQRTRRPPDASGGRLCQICPSKCVAPDKSALPGESSTLSTFTTPSSTNIE